MRNIKYTTTFILFLLATGSALGQGNCPSCEVSLPGGLPADTILLTEAPDGQVGVAYDGTVSFRLPKSTTPVNELDPGIPAGIALDKITIVSLSNVPPGLNWEPNQFEFDVRELTDGCLQFCGTPLLPGVYEVEVVVEARILIINQQTTFSFELEILPSERVTEGFIMENNTGCGSVEVNFTNQVLSGGNSGFDYFWDFGNGNMSVLEQPNAQIYNEPGAYEVNYRAIVDTFGHQLTRVKVEQVNCGDLLNKPDLQLKVFDPNGVELFSSNVIDNTDPPLTFELSVAVDTGNYTLQVLDDDQGLGGGDDVCGTVNFNQATNGQLTDDGFSATISIINPIDTILSKDSVYVFEQPATPQITLEGDASASCEGDTLVLLSPYSTANQWYVDSFPLLPLTNAFEATTTGYYWVTYTSPDGCSATSEAVSLSFPEPPEEPVFTNDRNSLELFETVVVPENYMARWYLDEMLMTEGEGLNLCAEATGRYELEIEDLSTGCTNSFARAVTFDPAAAGCNTTSTRELPGIADLVIYPNPSKCWFTLQFEAMEVRDLTYEVLSIQGQRLFSNQLSSRQGTVLEEIDLTAYPDGVYLLRLVSGKRHVGFRLSKVGGR